MSLSRSTFYDPPPAPVGPDELVTRIGAICDEFECYGYRRVGSALRQQGVVVNGKKLRRLMREYDLQPKRRRRYVTTTDGDHAGPIFPDLAKGIVADGPNQLWVADLTYVSISGGFVYLAAILDAWSRKVVGYAISRSMDARIAVAALKAAIRNRVPAKGCIHHSDSQRINASFPGGLALIAMDPSVRLAPRGARCGLTHTQIDQPCLSPDLSAARERLAVRLCLADACDPRRA